MNPLEKASFSNALENSSEAIGVQTVKPDLLPEVETMVTPMTAEGRDNIKVFHFELNRMVALSEVHSFVWNEEKGRRLRSLRGEMIRSELVALIEEQGVQCGQTNIHKLETGMSKTVTQELITAICKALATDISYFFPTAQIGLDYPTPTT